MSRRRILLIFLSISMGLTIAVFGALVYITETQSLTVWVPSFRDWI